MSNSNAQVLLVDDEWTIRQQLSRALGSVGIECECAIDGDDALDRYLHHRHELVVTDLRMPERNGHSLAVTLLEQTHPPKVIALTGVTEPRLAKDLLARGVADVVFKPINYFDLADRLKSMLQPSAQSQVGVTEKSTTVGSPDATESPGLCVNPLCPTRRELEQRFMASPPPRRWLMTTLQWIDWEMLPNPTAAILDGLNQLSLRPRDAEADRRLEGRVTLDEKAVVLALDDDFEPVGQPFKVMIRDLSQHGIGLVHSQRLANQLIAVSWLGLRKTRIVVVARVLRSRKLESFFEIGAMIVRLPDAASEKSISS